MLALASGGKLHLVALQHLQKGLLHALVARICRNGVVLPGFAGDLVEFIQIDDAVLAAAHILVGGVVKVADCHLYIGAYKACLGEAGGIRNGKGNIQPFGQMGQEGGLAAAGRPHDDNVGLLYFIQLVILVVKAVLHALVVVVDSHGQDFLCPVLIDDVLVQVVLYQMRLDICHFLVDVGSRLHLLLVLLVSFMSLYGMINILDAVGADGKIRARVINRQIVL